MTGWIRRVLARFFVVRQPLQPLPLKAAELAETKPQHDSHINQADALLKDFKRFDGQFRMVAVRKR